MYGSKWLSTLGYWLTHYQEKQDLAEAHDEYTNFLVQYYFVDQFFVLM